MNSDRITNRITDLLKLAGVSDSQTVEELTDHYLSHIEEEVRRGVNSQKAVREAYQEIANLDTSYFLKQRNQIDKRGLFLFLLVFASLVFYFFQQKQVPTPIETKEHPIENISSINPPTGSPIMQTSLKVSSEFGPRINPFAQQRELHKGIDICAKIGTNVHSTGDGAVREAGYKSKAGKYIIIEHAGNFLTKYYHLSAISVSKNEKVEEGQIIGKVGNSGLSMMPHLHYEVLKDEVPLNPREFIEP